MHLARVAAVVKDERVAERSEPRRPEQPAQPAVRFTPPELMRLRFLRHLYAIGQLNDGIDPKAVRHKPNPPN
jgi:hypothetical protein